ncbi:uncharacterized protein ATC70_006441 [Mucor velutinosus]|uniref:RNA-directed DNA polymerase n=1 Tax=Mucor velutinosus TaxID=708070 RepID=A0AAN7HQ43_9FUNG|nr:hypothetical protein ATC70_006441 [Mucor velutinosus]
MADSNTKEFIQYMNLEKVKSIDMPRYELHSSLRTYIKEFELQANFVGIENMDICTVQLGRFMPPVIKNWLPTLPSSVRQNWANVTEQMLLQFGRPADEEYREFKSNLKRCQQPKQESIKLHSAKWKHLLSLLPDNHISDAHQISLFTQSLHDRGLRATLTAYVELAKVTTVQEVITKAIDFEHKARLNDNTDEQAHFSGSHTQSTMDDPMEVDYVNSSNSYKDKSTKRPFRNSKKSFNSKPRSRFPPDPVPRLYNKQGHPVCGHCFGEHRNYECPTQASSVHQTDTIEHPEDDSGLMELGSPVPLNHIRATSMHAIRTTQHDSFTPTTKIVIGDHTIHALWDTGSAITAMDYDTCVTLQLTIDNNQIISYTDVNNRTAQTMGITKLNLFGYETKFHGIRGLARQAIIGWDFMCRFQVNMNTKLKMFTLQTDNHLINLHYETTATRRCNIQLTDSQDARIQDVLQEFKELLRKDSDKPSVTTKMEFTIDTGDHPPIYIRPRHYHPDIQSKIDAKLSELERNGIVSKVNFTDWGFPVTAVPKPNGSLRICGNYVKLNAITKTIKYPFINLHHALQSLGNAKYFSKIDLLSGYFQIPIAAADKPKSALVTPNSTYVFNTMAMGMKNAPAHFQLLMDQVLGDMRYRTAIAYQDDTILFSDTFDNHVLQLRKLLTRLREANLTINIEKCQFGLNQINFLGFIVSDQGVHADMDKVTPITNLRAPTNIKEVERLLGMAGVYSKFISKYQVMVEPIRRLKIKDVPFAWESEQEHAFQELKRSLAALPYLKQPNFKLPFELHCDAATSAGIAVILCQRYDDTPYPLSFASRSVTKFEKNYSIRELEALAIIFGVKKFRMYLECNQFTVFTDHSSLQWLLNTDADKQPRLWRWCLFLQAYDFKVIYIPGKVNHAADTLSRAAIHAIVSHHPDIDWAKEQRLDPMLRPYFNNTNVKYSKHKVVDGILYKVENKQHKTIATDMYIMVPSHLVANLISKHHDSKFAGHGGIAKTKASLVKAHLYWTNMTHDINAYIQKCQICQRIKGHVATKHNMTTTHGTAPFIKVAIDYFGPLPTSSAGHQYVLVVIDTFTKYVELYPTRSTASQELASIMYTQFILRHGVPNEIMCDNGNSLGSQFTQQVARYVDINIVYTPPYHPSSNGIVERFMKTLRTMILSYTDINQISTRWSSNLRIIRFVYNNMYHHSIKTSPFELVHGRTARTPLSTIIPEKLPDSYNEQDTPESHFAKQLQIKLQVTFEHVHKHLEKIYDNQKLTPQFEINDKVYIFNNRISTRNNPRKLQVDWIGPCTIQKVLSTTRYDVINDATGQKHKNTHVSFLKPSH